MWYIRHVGIDRRTQARNRPVGPVRPGLMANDWPMSGERRWRRQEDRADGFRLLRAAGERRAAAAARRLRGDQSRREKPLVASHVQALAWVPVPAGTVAAAIGDPAHRLDAEIGVAHGAVAREGRCTALDVEPVVPSSRAHGCAGAPCRSLSSSRAPRLGSRVRGGWRGPRCPPRLGRPPPRGRRARPGCPPPWSRRPRCGRPRSGGRRQQRCPRRVRRRPEGHASEGRGFGR
jgi:hypothetical protein